MAKNKVVIPIEGDDKGFRQKLKGLEATAVKGAKAIAKSFVAVSGALVAAGGYAINLASDLEEVQNVVDVTFGKKGAAKIEAWAKEAKTAFGMSELQAKQFSGTMGAMVKSMGLSEDAVYDMSTELVQLAGDFASFYNIDHETAFEKIRSGISGETEPLKQLGINMSVANLEAFALSQGITKAYNSMTQAEQATLRYNYLMNAGKDAQGDFARTSDSLANQLRTAKLELDELAASAGGVLIPIASDALSVLSDLTGQLKEGFDTGGIEGLVESLGDVGAQLVSELADRAPDMLDAAGDLIESFVDGIVDNSDEIAESAVGIAGSLVEAFGDAAPKVVGAVGKIGKSIAKELGEAYPILKPFTGTVSLLADNIELCAAAFVIWKTSAAITGTITTVTTGIQTLTTGVQGATVAQKLWNAAMSANPIGAVVTGVVALTAGIVGLVSAFDNAPEWEKECEEIRTHRQELEKSNAEWQEVVKAQKNAEASTNSEMNHIQKLSQELRGLADENGNVAESERARAQFILEELNEALGTEYSINQGRISQYQQLSAEVDNLIAKKRAEALLSSKQEAYDSAVGQIDEKKAVLQEETRQYQLASEAVESLTNQIEYWTQKQKELEKTKPPDWEYEYDSLTLKIDDLNDELEGANAKLKEQKGAMNAASVAVNDLNTTISDYEGTYENIIKGDYDAVFKGSYKSASGYAEGTSAALTDGQSDVEATASTIGQNVANAVGDGLKIAMPNTDSAMKEFGNQLNKTMSPVIEGARAEGENLILSLAGGVSLTIPDAVKGSEDGSTQIIDGLKVSDAVAEQIGVDYIQGVINGVNTMINPLYTKMVSVGQICMKGGLMKGTNEKSPSKDGEDIGAWYIEGTEIGVEKESQHLFQDMKDVGTGMSGSFAASLSHGMNTIRSEIASITGVIQEEAEENVKSFDAELKKIEMLRDFGIDDEETYYKKLEFLRDNYLTKNSDKWIDITQELYDYQEAQLEEHRDNIEDVYDDIADHITDKLDEVAEKQEKLAEKLSESVDVVEKYTITIDGESTDYYRLNDLGDEIAQAKEYRELMNQAVERVKASGISDDAVAEVLNRIDEAGTGEDGIGYLRALVTAKDSEFSSLMHDFEELSLYNEGTAAQRYSDDMAAAAEESYRYLVDELTRAGLDIPEGFFVSGTLSAEQFGQAFMAELELQMQEIQTKLSEYNAKISASIGAAAGNVNNDNRTTTYHIYGDNSNNTVKQIQNMETIKRLSGQ